QQAIPHVLDGRDLIGIAQTGTGKTAAFALPTLQRLKHRKDPHVKVLVLAPTRELALQIEESFRLYGKHVPPKSMTVFGGVSKSKQVNKLKGKIDIVVATPGRLLDLMNDHAITLEHIEMLILDEADRMLDMGFLPDIKRIIKRVPQQRQTLLFSATMPAEIQALAGQILTDPVTVAVTPASTTVEAIRQEVYFVDQTDKRKLLEHLIEARNMHRTLVFTRTKHGANRLSKQLSASNIRAEAIHGNKSQAARQSALANFSKGKTQVLVATDIASRGLDVDDISHVVNYDLPNESESYVHRIGRTGRAGAGGVAVSFCAADERKHLSAIERLIQLRIPVVDDNPYPGGAAPVPQSQAPKSRHGQQKSRNSQSSRHGQNSRNGNNNNGNKRHYGSKRRKPRNRQPQKG
ncbi:MAG: DEAD/DEAH box helicase, partial [Anaerolineales bacterium]